MGPKYECFENERTIRQRMADLSVVQLHTQDFRHHPKEAQPLRIKRKTSVDHVLPVDVVETIAQAHGCVSLNHDAEMVGCLYTKEADIEANQITDKNYWTEFNCNRGLQARSVLSIHVAFQGQLLDYDRRQ